MHFWTIGAVIKRFEGGDGAIFLESLGCRGVESTLIECSHPPINVHDCDHSDDVGVLCNRELNAHLLNIDKWDGTHQLIVPVECTDGDVVLLYGPNSNEGTVEVCTSGYWSTVCSPLWDSREASIVCRQLGLPSLGVLLINLSDINLVGNNVCSCIQELFQSFLQHLSMAAMQLGQYFLVDFGALVVKKIYWAVPDTV